MEYPEKFTITCPACGSTLRGEGTVLGGGWLYTCENCGQQATVTDEALEQAKQSGHKTITGQPLVSGKSPSQKTGTNPLIADAKRRAGEIKTTNPLIENAQKRALTAQEVA